MREDQFIAIAENRFDDPKAFKEDELADVMIVIGYYRMLSGFIQTFNLPIDP